MGVSRTTSKRRKYENILFTRFHVHLIYCVLDIFGLVKYLLVLRASHGALQVIELTLNRAITTKPVEAEHITQLLIIPQSLQRISIS